MFENYLKIDVWGTFIQIIQIYNRYKKSVQNYFKSNYFYKTKLNFMHKMFSLAKIL